MIYLLVLAAGILVGFLWARWAYGVAMTVAFAERQHVRQAALRDADQAMGALYVPHPEAGGEAHFQDGVRACRDKVRGLEGGSDA